MKTFGAPRCFAAIFLVAVIDWIAATESSEFFGSSLRFDFVQFCFTQ